LNREYPDPGEVKFFKERVKIAVEQMKSRQGRSRQQHIERSIDAQRLSE